MGMACGQLTARRKLKNFCGPFKEYLGKIRELQGNPLVDPQKKSLRKAVESLQLLGISKAAGPEEIHPTITKPLASILGEALARQGQITRGLARIGHYYRAQGGGATATGMETTDPSIFR